MAVFKCKMCGGTIEFDIGATVGTCDSCGTRQTLPKFDSEKRANLYDRANHFRRNNDFDKAAELYNSILNEDSTDAEAYWSLVLCRYGIEYVEDPATHKRIPTVNRAQYTSVLADEDYKSALKYADTYQRTVYEAEAKAVDEIQKGILAISQKEEPFDVFICYKETDANGRRTQDSVLATELYHELVREGYKAFFSRITLEDKLGQEYEPYIFAALNSARVMVVLGTRPEHFNAVWVKNEWSRYLALIKNGARKMLIPAYRDMDPYDLPEEFSHLQAQDMSKLGFMQDLLRGIKKVLGKEQVKPVKETVVIQSNGGVNTAPLVKRAYLALETGEWERADEFCENALNQDPECAEAYLCKLMAKLRVNLPEQLAQQEEPFDEDVNFKMALRFGDDAMQERLHGYIDCINQRKENARLQRIFDDLVSEMDSARTEEKYRALAKQFSHIETFGDAAAMRVQCLEKAEACRKDGIYAQAQKLAQNAKTIEEYEKAIALWESILPWKDSEEQIGVCRKEIQRIQAEQEQIRQEELRREEERRAEEQRKEEARIRAEEQRKAEKRKKEEQRQRQEELRRAEKEKKEAQKAWKKEQREKERQLKAEHQKNRIYVTPTVSQTKEAEKEKAPQKRKKTPLILGIAAVGVAVAVGLCAVLGVFGKKPAPVPEPEPVEGSDPEVEIPTPDVAVGDHIFYGTYEQDYNETNGAEPVEWRVLDKDGTKLLVITEFAIGWAPMDGEDNDPTLTWETCEGRRWLNEEMFNDLFTPQQQQAILPSTVTADENWVRPEIDQGNDTQDHLFYLSGKEVKTYFKTPEELKCYKLQREDDGTLYYDRISYWLRTRGVTTHYTEGVFPGFVITFPYGGQSLRFGEPDMEQAQFYYWSQGARPAMWIETRGLNDLTVIKKADVEPVQSKSDTPVPAGEASMFTDEEIANGLRFRYMSHRDYSAYYTMTYAQACAGYAFSNGRCGGSNWPMQVYVGDYEYSNFECYVENEALGVAERVGSKVQMWTADIATQREGDTNLVITINGKDYLFPWHAGNDCYGVARW